MSIVSSTIIEDAPQVDGRRAIRERHTDSHGIAHDVDYLAEADADVESILATHAAGVAAQLAATEVKAIAAFMLTGNSPTQWTFTDVDSQTAYRALLAHFAARPPEESLALAPVVTGFTRDALIEMAGISGETADKILAWGAAVNDAKTAADSARTLSADVLAEVA